MEIRNLIEQLESIANQHGDNVEIRLAIQPNWPFEHSIGDVVCLDPETAKEAYIYELIEEGGMTWEEANEAFESTLHQIEPKPIVYIAENRQIGYLDGAARSALGW